MEISNLMLCLGLIFSPIVYMFATGELEANLEASSVVAKEQKEFDSKIRDEQIKINNLMHGSKLALERVKTCIPVYQIQEDGSLLPSPLNNGDNAIDSITGIPFDPGVFICNSLGFTAEVDLQGKAIDVYQAAEEYQSNGFGAQAEKTDLSKYLEIYIKREELYSGRQSVKVEGE